MTSYSAPSRRSEKSASRHAALRGLVFLLPATLLACGKPPQGPPPRGPSNVTVMTIAPHEVPVSYEFVAQTQSPRAVNIQARVSGFLDRRVYTEGSVVKADQVLFLMDKKPFQAQLDQAKAALQQQQAGMENAQANLTRTKPLVEQDALSPKDLDDATGQYRQAAAAVEQAKQQVVQAQLNLSYCTITSPVDGVSSFAQQADGTYISTSNSLLTTVSVLSPMWVNFSISENQFQNYQDAIKKGLVKVPANGDYEVEVVLVDGSVFPYKGHITFQQPDYDTKTGTFLVRAAVDNPQGVLRPNQFVRARIIGITRPNAVLVPQRAVQQGAKGHFVWVVNKDNKAESRPVTLGQWHGDDWFIDEGLMAGERVVVDGALTLAPGATVQVTESAAGAKSEAVAGAPK
jgi:membrane fusion protein, multidrug efflux system